MLLFWNLRSIFICCLEGSICHPGEVSTLWPLHRSNLSSQASNVWGRLAMATGDAQTQQLPREVAGADTHGTQTDGDMDHSYSLSMPGTEKGGAESGQGE